MFCKTGSMALFFSLYALINSFSAYSSNLVFCVLSLIDVEANALALISKPYSALTLFSFFKFND